MMNIATILMAPAEGGNPFTQLLPFLLIIVVFYFFMIRPQAKKAKTERQFKENLKRGDKVVTNGGIHGKIVEMTDKTIVLEVENGVKLKVDKWAISVEATGQLAKQE